MAKIKARFFVRVPKVGLRGSNGTSLYAALGLSMGNHHGACWILLGCDGMALLKSLPSQLTLEAYKPTGELVSKQVLGADNPIYQKLALLLNTEQSGWKKNFVSYKTGTYIL